MTVCIRKFDDPLAAPKSAACACARVAALGPSGSAVGHSKGTAGRPPELVRLRADPSKVRVRVQKLPIDRVRVTVSGAHGNWDSIDSVVLDALNDAEQRGFPGLNLDLEEAYDHPQRS